MEVGRGRSIQIDVSDGGGWWDGISFHPRGSQQG